MTTASTPSSSEGYVVPYDSATGEESWKQDGISHLGTPTVGAGIVYAGGRTNFESDTGDAVVVAVDAASGDRE